MFAPSVRSSTSSRREKPYTRKPKAMVRSGSIIGTIKNIVSAPLSWFATNQENFEDLGKRSRLPAQDIPDVEDGQAQHKDKRMRIDSPSPERRSERERGLLSSGGYLDPPPSSSQSARSSSQRSRAETNLFKRRSSAFAAPPMSSARTMSVDPPSRYATLNRDPAMVPLPPGSPIRSSPARSVGPDDGPQRPRTPFKLRTSLTPQPSPVRPARRESSAPPPLSSLQTRPMFVRPPSEEGQSSKHITQKTVSLGTLADFNRASRAPSLDRTLNNLGHSASLPSQIASSASSDAILQPTKSRSEKAFRELEMYKTPILPSRYKDASTIPAFLRPKRAHVPIPMPKKGRQSKPSLGMSTETTLEKGETTGHEGKPYARTGGVGKMLARRRAEEEEEQDRISAKASLARVEEEDEMDTDMEASTHRRDVGVSTLMTSSSEDERPRSHKAADRTVEVGITPSFSRDDPFLRQSTIAPGGRHQPYGRIGRTRTRDPGQRSVPLGRPTNRFSAVADEDETTDDVDQGFKMDVADISEKTQPTGEGKKGPAYEPPKGFSFAKDAPVINHERVQAKELPIASLPFSLGDEGSAGNIAGKVKEAASSKPPVSAFSPVPQQSEQGGKKKDEPAPAAPKVSVVPPTPDQSAAVTKDTSVPSNFFASFSGASGAASSPATDAEPKSTGIPNFFASSPLLAGDKAAAAVATKPLSPSPSATPGAAPATPVKDPENPLWNGNEALPSAPPKLFAGATKPFTFGAKPTDSANSSGPSVIPAPLFGGSFNREKAAAPGLDQKLTAPPSGSTVPPAGLAPSLFAATTQAPAPAKSTEAENKPAAAAPSPIFNFGTSASANAPKPLFGTGSSVTTPPGFSMQPSNPAQSGSVATGQKRPFSFGASEASTAEKETTQPIQPVQNGASEHKAPFSFGSSPMANAAGNTSATPSTGAAAAPKSLFGGASGGFTFGPQAASAAPAPSIDTTKTASPFAFGAQPSTPPAAAERGGSPFTFGTQAPSSTGSAGFSFTTPVKANGTAPESAPSTPTNASPFTFGAPSAQPPRPVTPPSKPDEGMIMEESPVQMDTGAEQKKASGSITFGSGPTPTNPFGPPSTSGSMFTFGAQSSGGPASNLFAPKDANKPSDGGGGFNFNRTSSAPAISTSFSFGAKSDQPTPPATAFGTPSNPFGQPQTSSSTTSSPFSFGQQQQQSSMPVSNPFGAPSHPAAAGSTPSSPFQSAPQFTFGTGAPSGAPNNPFAFGSSAPSSPANGVTGLPQSSGASSGPAFTFGQPNGSSGSTLFNIGAPPPSNAAGGTPGRQIKKLPRRGGPALKR